MLEFHNSREGRMEVGLIFCINTFGVNYVVDKDNDNVCFRLPFVFERAGVLMFVSFTGISTNLIMRKAANNLI